MTFPIFVPMPPLLKGGNMSPKSYGCAALIGGKWLSRRQQEVFHRHLRVFRCRIWWVSECYYTSTSTSQLSSSRGSRAGKQREMRWYNRSALTLLKGWSSESVSWYVDRSEFGETRMQPVVRHVSGVRQTDVTMCLWHVFCRLHYTLAADGCFSAITARRCVNSTSVAVADSESPS